MEKNGDHFYERHVQGIKCIGIERINLWVAYASHSPYPMRPALAAQFSPAQPSSGSSGSERVKRNESAFELEDDVERGKLFFLPLKAMNFYGE